MILRAVFWIGVVSLLAPHEPDLGLGHPGAGTSQPSPAKIQPSLTGQDCGSTCAGGLGLFTVYYLNTAKSVRAGLADVKVQVEADQRARHLRAKAI